MTRSRDAVAGEFLAVAQQALQTSEGRVALDSLGWWDLLPDLDDDESRRAMFALFRAQGRMLTSSPALGALTAQPFVDAMDAAPGSVVATALRPSPRRGPVHVVVGDLGQRRVLVDCPGEGAWIVDDDAPLQRIDVPGGLVLHEVEVDLSRCKPWVSEREASLSRKRSRFLGRVAIALEILGAAETALDLAVRHARDREQFGQPIGSFQAVRHLLAWARTDCEALEHSIAEAVVLDDTAPPMYAETVKALAGRNGRRTCERALQVLGGVGFTAEHDHHRYHSRVLTLDGLLGTSAELTHELGTWLRATGTDPGFPTAVLLADRSR